MSEIPSRRDVSRMIASSSSAMGDVRFTKALYQDRGSLSRQINKLHKKDPLTGESAAMRGAKRLNEKDPVTGESLGMKGTRLSCEVRTAKAKGERVAQMYGQQEVHGITVQGIPHKEPGKRWTGMQARRREQRARETSHANEGANEGVLWSHGQWDTLPDALQAQRAAEQQGIPEGQRRWHERLKREMNGNPGTSSDSE